MSVKIKKSVKKDAEVTPEVTPEVTTEVILAVPDHTVLVTEPILATVTELPIPVTPAVAEPAKPLRDDRGVEVVRKNLDSHLGKLTSGSIHLGIRLYKTGEYAAKRTWHAVMGNAPVFVCETENIGKGNWCSTDFKGKQHTGRSRSEVINASVSEFIKETATEVVE